MNKKLSTGKRSISHVFLMMLEDRLGVELQTIYDLAVNLGFADFMNIIGKNSDKVVIDFFEFVEFNDKVITYYRKEFQKIRFRIESYIHNGNKIKISQFIASLYSYNVFTEESYDQGRFNKEEYQAILKATTTINQVEHFNTRDLNLVWYHDLIHLDMFKDFEAFLLLFVDTATRGIVHYKLYETGGNTINSDHGIQALDNAISKGYRTTILYCYYDLKNRSKKTFEAIHQCHVVLSLNKNVYHNRDPKHGNQIIEQLDRRLKEMISDKIINK